MDNLISVIVPIYNVEKYLEQCIESIIAQTYFRLEIILVDDGSIDNSGKICDEYREKDSRIKVIHHKSNLGTVRARKTGLLNSTGNIVTFLDGDDWIDAKMYEKLFGIMDKYEVDIVTSIFAIERKGYSYISDVKMDEGIYGLKIGKDMFVEYIFRGFSTSANNKIFKRHVVMQHMLDIEDEIYGCHDDTVWVVPALLEAARFYISNESFYHYRTHNESITHKYSSRWLEKLNLVILHLTECSEKYNWSNKIKEVINYFINSSVINSILHISNNILFPSYFIDIDKRIIGKKIVLYGAGKVGYSLYLFLKKINVCDIVLWVDRISDRYEGVKDVKFIENINFDLILIAVLNENAAGEIVKSLAGYKEKCLWIQPKSMIDYFSEENKNQKISSIY